MSRRTPSLFHRITLLVHILIAVFVLALVWMSFRQSRVLRDDIALRNEMVAHTISDQVSYLISKPLGEITSLATTINKDHISSTTVQPQLDAILSSNPICEQVFFLDEQQRVKAVSPASPDVLDLDFSSQPFVQQTIRTKKITLSDAFFSPTTSHLVMTVCAPLDKGMLVADINLEPLSRMLHPTDRPTDTVIVIMDRRGKVLAHTDPRVYHLSSNYKNLRVVSQAIKGNTSVNEEKLDGASGLATVVTVKSAGWLVMVFQSYEMTLSILRREALFAVILILSVYALTYIGMRTIIIRILRPIESLTEQTRKFARGESIDDIDGTYLELQGLSQDFSIMAKEVRRRVEMLRQSETRFKALFDESSEACLLADVTGHILMVNNAAEALVEQQDMVNSSLLDYLDLQDDQVRYTQFLENPKARRILLQGIWRPNKSSQTYIEVGLAKIEINDKQCLFATIRDITERRLREEHQAQLSKMESVGRLAGAVAHDFNNLITGISGLVELTKMNLEEQGIYEADLDEVLQLTRDASDLTRQLLTFSRKQPVEETAIELNSHLYNSVQLMKRLVGRQIAVEFIPHMCSLTVKANRGHLEQIIMNLMVNARDAMPNGGNITISLNKVEINLFTPAGSGLKPGFYAQLMVSDTGCGIDEEIKAHIFEPFFTTKDEDHGTGLGLSTVYGIVKQNDGWIEVTSTVGVGTSFHIYLPLAQS